MRKVNLKFVLLALILPAFLCGNETVIAQIRRPTVNGHAGGNGGDPTVVRRRMIAEFINTELRGELENYFRTLNLMSITNVITRAALQDMVNHDVYTDIRTSSYVFMETCLDIGGLAAGGANNQDLGGEICFSPRRLAEINASRADIVALAVHEHAHHFGYEDRDAAIQLAVFRTVTLAHPSWEEALEVVVPLPGTLAIVLPNQESPGSQNPRVQTPQNAPQSGEVGSIVLGEIERHSDTGVILPMNQYIAFFRCLEKNPPEIRAAVAAAQGYRWMPQPRGVWDFDPTLPRSVMPRGAYHLPNIYELSRALYPARAAIGLGEPGRAGYLRITAPDGSNFFYNQIANIWPQVQMEVYWYWSSSVHPDDSSGAFVLGGYDGHVGAGSRNSIDGYFVRCARSR